MSTFHYLDTNNLDREKHLYKSIFSFLILEFVCVFILICIIIRSKKFDFDVNDFDLKKSKAFFITNLVFSLITSGLIIGYYNEIYIDEKEEEYINNKNIDIRNTTLATLIISCISLLAVLYYSSISITNFDDIPEFVFEKNIKRKYLLIYLHFIPGWILIGLGKIRKKKKEEITTTSTPQIVN